MGQNENYWDLKESKEYFQPITKRGISLAFMRWSCLHLSIYFGLYIKKKLSKNFFSYFLCGIFCFYKIPKVEISFWSGMAFSVYQGRPTSLQRAFEALTFEMVTIYFLFVPQVFNSRLRKPCLHIMVFFLLYLGTYFN